MLLNVGVADDAGFGLYAWQRMAANDVEERDDLVMSHGVRPCC